MTQTIDYMSVKYIFFNPSFLKAAVAILALLSLCPYFVEAQDLVTLQEEVQTDTEDRSLAQNKALNIIAADLVKKMIGQARYQQNKDKIEGRIISDKKRYVLSVSSSAPDFGEDGKFISIVTVKVSKKNLKRLLLEHNLFYGSKGAFCLLPVISFALRFEEAESFYAWWLEDSAEDPLLRAFSSDFFELMESRLIRDGFYFLRPLFQKLREGTPLYALPKNSSKVKNFALLSEFYNCDIILSGGVESGAPPAQKKQGLSWALSFFQPSESNQKRPFAGAFYKTRIFFNVFNIKTRQVLFKIKKSKAFEPPGEKSQARKEMSALLKEVLDSFIYQLASYNERGSLELSRVLIGAQGSLTYAQKERFKKNLIEQIPGIRSLQERLVASRRVVYEAEVSQDSSALAHQIKKARFPDFAVQLKGRKAGELELYVKPKN